MWTCRRHLNETRKDGFDAEKSALFKVIFIYVSVGRMKARPYDSRARKHERWIMLMEFSRKDISPVWSI